MTAKGETPAFKAFWSPFSNILCLAFMAVIIAVIWMIPDVRASVYAIPVWLLIIYGFFRESASGGFPGFLRWLSFTLSRRERGLI